MYRTTGEGELIILMVGTKFRQSILPGPHLARARGGVLRLFCLNGTFLVKSHVLVDTVRQLVVELICLQLELSETPFALKLSVPIYSEGGTA